MQTVAGRSYESYVQTEILDPLQMRGSFTSAAAAEHHGLATGYRYWFGRPRAADLPYNRGLVPAGYLISDAEDMSHYLIAQLNRGRYGSTSVLSPEGVDELHRPAVQTPKTGTSYGMGWFVGPINGIPAIHHQGETFNFHANAVLVPGSRTGVIVLMNAENSVDLFLTGRMGTISEGVTSLLEGRDPAPAPSGIATFVVYVLLFGIVVLQLRSIARWVTALRRGRVPRGRIGPRVRIALALALSLGWAVLVLVLVPKQLGLPLLVVAQGLPDLAYLLLLSGVVALCWGIVRSIWAYATLRRAGRRSHCGCSGRRDQSRCEPVMSTITSRQTVQAGGLARLASAVTRETALTLIAVGIVGLHIVDDNFLQPEPGTSAGDHLASGLIPVAVLAAIAVVYPRLRAGLRAITAMTLGALAITVGVPSAYYLLDGSASGDHFTGLLAIVAGVVLLLIGPVTLWRARRTDGSRRRRYLRRALIVVATPVSRMGDRLVHRLPDRLRLHLRAHRASRSDTGPPCPVRDRHRGHRRFARAGRARTSPRGIVPRSSCSRERLGPRRRGC